jgi:hypothetical protein
LEPDDDIAAAIADATQVTRPRGEGLRGERPAAAVQIDRISYTHDAVIDFIIANPQASQGHIASTFGYTQAWMSTIINSDAFQARLRSRRGEVVDPALVATINDRFRGVLARSLERLAEKLEEPSPPPNVILKAVELGARGLDVGGFGRAQVNLPPPPPAGDRLAALAERLVSLQQNVRKGNVYEDAQLVGE